MVEKPRLIVEPKPQGGDALPALRLAEAADDAIRCPVLLDLRHRPFAMQVRQVEALRDDAVERAARRRQPCPRLGDVEAARREAQALATFLLVEVFQQRPALFERCAREIATIEL